VYTIKEASARSGVSVPLLRAWERRYGVVRPTRTAAGYRLYDDQAIESLGAMRRLVDAGWAPSEAARAITAGEVAVEPSGQPDARLADRFVDAAGAMDDAAVEAILDEILVGRSFEAVVDDLLLPAARSLGDAWAAGRLDVAAEHAASAAVQRRLAEAYQAAGAPRPPEVLVGLPPGSRHELGALAFAVVARRRGLGVVYLGPDVPVDSWVQSARRTGARAGVIGVVTEGDAHTALDVARELHARADGTLVAFGGAAATSELADAAGATLMPIRVVAAARELDRTIRRT
jgi:DNA-binding transcriptional MerR regulator